MSMPPRARSAPACTRALLALVLALLASACAGDRRPSPSAAGSPTAGTSTPTASASARATPSPSGLPDYGGQGVRWPRLRREAAPHALGAVRTLARVARGDGGTLAAGLTLPRVGGSATAPLVLTPCGTRTTVRGRLAAVPPSTGRDVLVVVDPGHGGRAAGTHAPDGTREADVVLDISHRLARALTGRVDRVVLTRERDVQTSLTFRVALADALHADLALSVHLNAVPETTRSTPGTSTYASVADPAGRRAAGVTYAAVRSYLTQWTPQVGRWAANRDSGALYRLGRDGRDYYGLLRRAHVTWVIVESAYLSAPREASLLARAQVRNGLAAALADAAVLLTARRPGVAEQGSGWRSPLRRPPDPPAPPAEARCTDPA